jgi:uncharacterized protein YggE
MNTNYKPLVWSGTIVMIILGVFLSVAANKAWNTAAFTNTVSFTGEGKVSAKPDIAKINFSIVTSAQTSKAAQDDNSRRSKAVADYLKSQNISDKDIKTLNYNISPQYSSRPCTLFDGPCFIQKQIISGYQASQTMEVKVRNLDNASNIMDGLVFNGANQVNQLSFEIDNTDTLKAQARTKAIADTEKKAGEFVGQTGISLGKIVGFYETLGVPTPIFYDTKASGTGGGFGGPSVPSGENEITVNVTLTYQIK